MKGRKPVWIDERYVDAAKKLKRKSPPGRKITVEQTINDWVEAGRERIPVKKKNYLPKNGEEEK